MPDDPTTPETLHEVAADLAVEALSLVRDETIDERLRQRLAMDRRRFECAARGLSKAQRRQLLDALDDNLCAVLLVLEVTA